MRAEIANLVHPVLAHGLRLKRALEQGEAPVLEAEQAVLTALLRGEVEARRITDYGGDPQDRRTFVELSGFNEPTVVPGRAVADRFLGIRYALACWLDELFILDSPWAAPWNERKMEVALFTTNDRAWRFWEQARVAVARKGGDALEVFFLCVLLGFRGDLADDPDRLRAWVADARTALTGSAAREWPAPPELPVPPRVPPLTGRQRLQRMLLIAGAGLLVLIPALALFLVRQLT
jgi:type VI secretion system protein ImpK